MRHAKIFFSVAIFHLIFLSTCYGQIIQNYSELIRRRVDSLDNIVVSAIKYDNPDGNSYTIRIKTQEQFDKINDILSRALKTGHKRIIIKLSKGVYCFKENHIRRKNEEYKDVSVRIEGRGAIITSNYNYKRGTFERGWSELIQMDTTVFIEDERQGICRIPIEEGRYIKNMSNFTKIQIPQWYKSPTYSIISIDDRGIYFRVPELTYVNNYDRLGYSINMDYLYRGKKPRYRLYNPTVENNYKSSKFVKMDNVYYRSFELVGLRFDGNKDGNELLSIENTGSTKLIIRDCVFENIKSTVGYFSNASNVIVDTNVFKNTDGDELVFVNGCHNTRIISNTFEDCGIGLRNTMCVKCVECEYYIANNVFRDFGYGAIGVGVWEEVNKTKPSRGIIEHNEIYYTRNYLAQIDQHTLMDSGAIYTWTQNDDVIIRYNYIHDYNGISDNKGIFCDDGASNINIYGNVVLNISNSYCIASRMKRDFRSDYRNNSKNFVAYNIIDGSVCFMGYDTENRNCVKGMNLILTNAKPIKLKNNIKSLQIEEQDSYIIGYRFNGKVLSVSRYYKGLIEKYCNDSFISSIIEFI